MTVGGTGLVPCQQGQFVLDLVEADKQRDS